MVCVSVSVSVCSVCVCACVCVIALFGLQTSFRCVRLPFSFAICGHSNPLFTAYIPFADTHAHTHTLMFSSSSRTIGGRLTAGVAAARRDVRQQSGVAGDVVTVVGGGAIGVASCYRLAECGYKVRLFERHDKPGLECSYSNAALLSHSARPKRLNLQQMAQYSIQTNLAVNLEWRHLAMDRNWWRFCKSCVCVCVGVGILTLDSSICNRPTVAPSLASK